MAFDQFQTATAMLKRIDTDGFGDEAVTDSFEVQIDPVFGWKRAFDDQGEQYTGKTTVISGNDRIDPSHTRWRLEYNDREYQVSDMMPFYSIGGNLLEHVEVVLR